MMDNIKPHLWIPEQEINNIPKTPTSRDHQYDLSYAIHGQTLSQGLLDIIL